MPSKTSSTLAPPSVGTFIDNGSLELVEVLGVGGYGVVYRALDVRTCFRKSYAVKCLIHTQSNQSARLRKLHLREIELHYSASKHPNVVTLHRVVEEPNYTYLVMEYAYDGDLFSQILHNSRYLGDDCLIKHVFLQIVDSVLHCHSLGVYHRDLKPENVLCFDGGLRVAITDFGLATTDKFSDEFRTGSLYHMSLECQGGKSSSIGTYSPQANDIWSLAIVLLNLVTGRNPWKSASLSDLTFQAYLADRQNFLPTVLPISQELNALLVQMLDIDWSHRIPLQELRAAIEDIDTFYSDGAIFEGSMARCPWEAQMDMESSSEYSSGKEEPLPVAEKEEKHESAWSHDSEVVFTVPSKDDVARTSIVQQASWINYSPGNVTWDFESSSPSLNDLPSQEDASSWEPPSPSRSTPSPLSTSGSESFPPPPRTPDGDREFPPKRLFIDTAICQNLFFDNGAAVLSKSSSVMQTAVDDYDLQSSSFFLPSAVSSKASCIFPFVESLSQEDREMEDASWTYSSIEADSYDIFSPTTCVDPEPPMQFAPAPPAIMSLPSPPTSDSGSSSLSMSPPPRKRPGPKIPSLFTQMKFSFQRSPLASPRSAATEARSPTQAPPRSTASSRMPSPTSTDQSWTISPKVPSTSMLGDSRNREGGCRRHTRLRSARHWFSPSKFFAVS